MRVEEARKVERKFSFFRPHLVPRLPASISLQSCDSALHILNIGNGDAP